MNAIELKLGKLTRELADMRHQLEGLPHSQRDFALNYISGLADEYVVLAIHRELQRQPLLSPSSQSQQKTL